MPAVPDVVAIFDIGKTNKKLLVFDEAYQPVLEESIRVDEIPDEEGFPCDVIEAIEAWVRQGIQRLTASRHFNLRAVNFSTYGASLLHLDEQGRRIAPLYNYLKPYPAYLLNRFLETYGGAARIGTETATPFTGHLNTGLQLYWLKQERPELFERIQCSLHFPQYLHYLLTGARAAELTTLGCHTGLWDFRRKEYHAWLSEEDILQKLPPASGDRLSLPISLYGREIRVGSGLHDSSAALVPYLLQLEEPFIVVSTGTWSISLNPFNHSLPTADELAQGCLDYLSFRGNPVKASMLFAGHDHDEQVKRIAAHFLLQPSFYQQLPYAPGNSIGQEERLRFVYNGGVQPSLFALRGLSQFADVTAAYRCLMEDILLQQACSIRQITGSEGAGKILVDGGFSRNQWFMQLLSEAFPGKEVMAASTPQGTALGAALAIHDHWNSSPLPAKLVSLQHFPRGN